MTERTPYKWQVEDTGKREQEGSREAGCRRAGRSARCWEGRVRAEKPPGNADLMAPFERPSTFSGKKEARPRVESQGPSGVRGLGRAKAVDLRDGSPLHIPGGHVSTPVLRATDHGQLRHGQEISQAFLFFFFSSARNFAM